MKTITMTNDQWHVVRAALEAAELGCDAYAAAQQAQERIHDVQPVAKGSEEELAIWTEIRKAFDVIRDA